MIHVDDGPADGRPGDTLRRTYCGAIVRISFTVPPTTFAGRREPLDACERCREIDARGDGPCRGCGGPTNDFGACAPCGGRTRRYER